MRCSLNPLHSVLWYIRSAYSFCSLNVVVRKSISSMQAVEIVVSSSRWFGLKCESHEVKMPRPFLLLHCKTRGDSALEFRTFSGDMSVKKFCIFTVEPTARSFKKHERINSWWDSVFRIEWSPASTLYTKKWCSFHQWKSLGRRWISSVKRLWTGENMLF